MMYVRCFLLGCLLLFLSCHDNRGKRELVNIVTEWKGKKNIFPETSIFTKMTTDTVTMICNGHNLKIVVYVDSIGCTSCKLGLQRWERFIGELDSITAHEVPCFFYIYPKNIKELGFILRRDNFDYPICIDVNDSFNKLNHFPSDTRFQTFLLDENNKVVAIGNPIHNPKVKELYLDIIQGKKSIKKELTTAKLNKTSINLSTFDWRKEKLADVELVNTGSLPLIIDDVVTSCSCTTVEFPRESVAPGQSVKLKIKYNAEKPEPFYRTVSIYCNTKDSPLEIEITGEGK